MSTREEYQEFSNRLRYGLEIAEQQLIEETARREGKLCYGHPNGKIIHIAASDVLKERENSGITCPQSDLVEGSWFR
ncbi:hypothetical protein [Phocaeicola abscessus]|uniref:hypothetical protein n=1 Tax=Phocaeicola abscessus TaxID=555313 RepID=UPI0003856953|nr:hypothetical protein [Phocaeicola abscessus]EPT32758.1 hypothetical protein HMPREF9012_1923 [Bacteroidetes bacterium oral taxon 272 str. F0290]